MLTLRLESLDALYQDYLKQCKYHFFFKNATLTDVKNKFKRLDISKLFHVLDHGDEKQIFFKTSYRFIF